MAKQHAWVLRFGELGLKSRTVRRAFQKTLRKNLMQLAVDAEVPLLRGRERHQDMVYSTAPVHEIESLLSHALGLAAFERITTLGKVIDPEQVAKQLLEGDPLKGHQRTFGVRVKRLGEKGEWNTITYSAALGAALCDLDSTLKVDLRHPDRWYRMILEPNQIAHIETRSDGPGGLPAGVQGDVVACVRTLDDFLSAFLILRRGTRILPVLESKEEYVQILKAWDPYLGRRSRMRDEEGTSHERPAWGVSGLELSDAAPYIQQRESAIKTTPLCTLEPLMGWTELEKEHLYLHILDPLHHPLHPDCESWIDS